MAKSVIVEMNSIDPKKSSVKFSTDDSTAAAKNVYVTNAVVEKLGGCENGVKVTIEAL